MNFQNDTLIFRTAAAGFFELCFGFILAQKALYDNIPKQPHKQPYFTRNPVFMRPEGSFPRLKSAEFSAKATKIKG